MDSSEPTPIPIPSEDNAWKDMRDRLDKEMPVAEPAPAAVRRNSFPGKMLWTLSMVLLLTLAILLLRKAPTQSLVSGGKSAGSDAAESPVARSARLPLAEKSLAPATVYKSADARPAAKKSATPPTENKFAAVATPKKYSRPRTRAQPLLSGRRISTSEEHYARPSSARALTAHEPDVVDRSPFQETRTLVTPLFSSLLFDSAAYGSSTKHLTSTTQLQFSDSLLLTFGLQWTEQFPPFDYLFRGIQGHSSYVRALLPSAWMQIQLDKSILGIELNPFYSQNASRVLETGYNPGVIGDTTVGTNTSRSLDKVFGLSVNIDFLTFIGGHWWAGGGLRTNWWMNAIGTDWTLVQKQTSAGYNSITETLHTGPISKSDWQYVPSFQLDLLGEILYRRGVSQAGFRLSVSPNAAAKDLNSDFFFESEFFYRLQLFSKKVYLRDP
jgi:hypothetical protein